MDQGNWLTGAPERTQQFSNLTQGQQGLQGQLLQMLQSGNPEAMKWLMGILSGNSDSFAAMEAPAMRQFNEDIIPGLSEQFAGMGSGGLSSSSFRNAAVNEGTNLSERLAQMRANLKQQAVQGLQGFNQQAMNPSIENMVRPAHGGFLGSLAGGVGQGIGQGITSLASGGFMAK